MRSRSHEEFCSWFLDYLEEQLDSQRREELERALREDVELARALESYREVVNLESALHARGVAPLSKDFSDRLMQQIALTEKKGVFGFAFLRRLSMGGFVFPRTWVPVAATVAICTLVIKVGLDNYSQLGSLSQIEVPVERNVGLESQRTESQGTPSTNVPQYGPVVPRPIIEHRHGAKDAASVDGASSDQLTTRTAPSKQDVAAAVPARSVPPGMREVEIPISSQSGIEGHAMPSSRMDVVINFDKDRSNSHPPRVLAQGAKVVEASGSKLRIVVSESDAKSIETARKLGKLSLKPTAELNSDHSVTIYDHSVAGSAKAVAGIHAPKPGDPYPEVFDGVALKEESQSPRSATILRRTLERIEESDGATARAQKGLPTFAIGMAVPGTAAQYQQAQENPRVETKVEAMSTFSIDVDTASYANMRRFIRENRLPPAAAIRVEELLNYFDYDYPVQQEQPFALSYEMGPSPFEPGRVLLKLGIKARDSKTAEHTPRNLVFLIDVSGSMMPEQRLPLLKQGLSYLVQNLHPSDRVAIVAYANATEVVLPSTSGEHRQTILDAIDKLVASGGTHGAAGITLAYQQARSNFIPSGVNRVILATDGDFNVGITSTDELVRMIEKERDAGVMLTTIGVGTANLNDAMMEQLSNKGDGNYFYLDGVREARKVFGTQLAGTLDTVAKDVKLQMEFNPAVVLDYRLIGYDNRVLDKSDFNNDRVDAGEIGAGHTVTALYELTLVGSPLEGSSAVHYRYKVKEQTSPAHGKQDISANNLSVENLQTDELGFLKIRYKEPQSDSSQLLQYPVASSDLREKLEQTSADFKFAAAVAHAGGILRASRFLPAGLNLENVISLAEAGLGADSKGLRREFVELLKDANLLMNGPRKVAVVCKHNSCKNLE